MYMYMFAARCSGFTAVIQLAPAVFPEHGMSLCCMGHFKQQLFKCITVGVFQRHCK
jgi:hypothetical protein